MNGTDAAPHGARQVLTAALAWALALGGGAAAGLAASHGAGSALGWPIAALAAAQPAPGQVDRWFDGSNPRAETRAFLALLHKAREDGLDPGAYQAEAIAAALTAPDAASRDRAAALLDAALAAYARDLRVPKRLSEITYIDPELIPAPPDPEALVAERAPAERLAAIQAANPVYQELRAGLAAYRRTWSVLPQMPIPAGPALGPGSREPRVALLRRRLGLPARTSAYDASLGAAVSAFREAHGLAPSPIADAATIAALNRPPAHYEDLIIAEMDQARGLPADGRRFILVDTAAAELTLIADGRETGRMRVVVGKPGMATPLLAGLIRYALVNPYWNVPPDLVRSRIAPAVLREGAGVIARRRYVLSADWQSTARIEPATVDWPGVAAGRSSIWVRQLPGGANMMGAVKFMLPNDMGIYLHDTPDKSLFLRADRHLSSGCVRLEDAPRLAAWLFGRDILSGDPAPDRRVDLAEPVAVFTIRPHTIRAGGQVRLRHEAGAASGA